MDVRFDTTASALFNVLSFSCIVASVVMLFLRRRQCAQVSGWLWLLLPAAIVVFGFYVPIGSLLVLDATAFERRPTDGPSPSSLQ